MQVNTNIFLTQKWSKGLDEITEMEIIYIVPETLKEKLEIKNEKMNVLSFSDLPENLPNSPFDNE